METIKKLYTKYREAISYLFWGGIAFVLSMVLFIVFHSGLGWNEHVANIVDWIICVLFTFVTNKLWVFRSKAGSIKAAFTEFIEFVAARVATLVAEELIIFIFITCMKFDGPIQSFIVKLFAQAVVIISNYFLSKFWIFRKKKDTENGQA